MGDPECRKKCIMGFFNIRENEENRIRRVLNTDRTVESYKIFSTHQKLIPQPIKQSLKLKN